MGLWDPCTRWPMVKKSTKLPPHALDPGAWCLLTFPIDRDSGNKQHWRQTTNKRWADVLFGLMGPM